MSKPGKVLLTLCQGAIMADADLALHTSYRMSRTHEVTEQVATKRRLLFFTVSVVHKLKYKH